MPLSSSQDGDEFAVDDEVGAGDVTGAVAGQQHDQVGHSSGRVNLPVTEPAAACSAASPASTPLEPATVSATPSSPWRPAPD
jgi:hypothetical protein